MAVLGRNQVYMIFVNYDASKLAARHSVPNCIQNDISVRHLIPGGGLPVLSDAGEWTFFWPHSIKPYTQILFTQCNEGIHLRSDTAKNNKETK